MQYDTLYDVSTQPFRWWQAAPCLIFLIVVVSPMLLLVMHPAEKRQKGMLRVFLSISLVLLTLWLLGVLVVTAMAWSPYHAAVTAQRSGDFAVFEGIFERGRASGGSELGGADSVTSFDVVSDAGTRREFKSPFPDKTSISELHLTRGDRIRVTHQGKVVLRIEKRQ